MLNKFPQPTFDNENDAPIAPIVDFGDLTREHQEWLFKQALILCRDPHIAKDLVQETLIQAWRSIHRFNHACRMSTWLYTILMHRHQNALRAAGIRPFFCLTQGAKEEALAKLHALGDSPRDETSRLERVDQIKKCLNALPIKQREVIQLRFYAGASLEEISFSLGCSLGTVKSRLFYALEALKKMNLIERLRD